MFFLDTECVHLLLAPKLFLGLALLFLKPEAFGALLLSFLVVRIANSRCQGALGHYCGLRTRAAGGARRGRVGKVVRGRRAVVRRLRVHRRGAGLADERGEVIRIVGSGLGSVPKVDEGRGARAPLLRALSLALGNHPVPGRIVDNLDLVSAVKLRPNLHRWVAALVPRTEVHEDARELLALLVLLGDHIHALHEAELERVHDGADALLRDVLEDRGMQML